VDTPRAGPPLPPLWLLDVDGVLNAVTRSPDRAIWPDWRRGRAVADGVAWSICFSPSATRAIRTLHESGLVEVRWLTTWREYANAELRRLLDLPELAVVPDASDGPPSAGPSASAAAFGSHETHGQASAAASEHGVEYGDEYGVEYEAPGEAEWWKLAAVRRVVEQEPGRALVWTDDELADRPEAVAWVRSAVASPLLIAPFAHTGLTPGHLVAIEEFGRRQAGRFD
jgi:hypothetical protein